MCERHRERCVCEREGERGREVSVGGVGVCKKCTVSVWCVCVRERERGVGGVFVCKREGGEGWRRYTRNTERGPKSSHTPFFCLFYGL